MVSTRHLYGLASLPIFSTACLSGSSSCLESLRVRGTRLTDSFVFTRLNAAARVDQRYFHLESCGDLSELITSAVTVTGIYAAVPERNLSRLRVNT